MACITSVHSTCALLSFVDDLVEVSRDIYIDSLHPTKPEIPPYLIRFSQEVKQRVSASQIGKVTTCKDHPLNSFLSSVAPQQNKNDEDSDVAFEFECTFVLLPKPSET